MATVAIVVVGLLRLGGEGSAHPGLAVVATCLYLPVVLWQLRRTALGLPPRGSGWRLGFVAVVVLGTLPVVGAQWLGALYPLAALVLLVVRMPWGLVVFAALVLLPIPVTHAYGQGGWAAYFALGVALFGPMTALPVLLIPAVRELREARVRLAEEAVVRERLRLDAELQAEVGTALDRIASLGDRPEQVREIVDTARGALANARRTLARFRPAPAHAELDAVATLLRAAGIEAEVDVPPGAPLPESVGVELRREVARLLADESVRRCRIAVVGARLEITR
ncbi:sensor histidine kinase [Saccharothrix variisporea]|uniref:hypothetical protein n=1 Tax=Saccharothrix variisporea TaxID=543527 RepID=UPI000EB17770|nr:hypothetical protein [Saccharothrix variisporea]